MRRRLPVVLSAVLVLAACTGGAEDRAAEDAPADAALEEGAAEVAEVDEADDATDEAPQPAVEGSGWTVLHYSIADTDLEPFMIDDIAEMAEVGSGDGLAIQVLADRAADYSADGIVDQPDWETAKTFDVEQGSLVEVADAGELDMGDPATLRDFITTGIEQHPAERYALILSDHGGGYVGIGGDESTEDHNLLDLPELQTAIGDGLAAAGVEQLDLLGFDACLMATYEVASAMAPLASTMVASTELEPGHGWDYRSLQVLLDDPATDAATLGSALLAGFQAQAEEQETSAEITLSLLDLTKMAALDTAVADFSAAVAADPTTVAPVLGAQRNEVLRYGKNDDPEQDTHLVDLGLLVSEVGVESLQVSEQADAVSRALGDVVLESVAGQATAGSSGLSVYFPPQQELLDANYAALPAAAGWTPLLDAFYGAGEAIPVEEQPAFTAAEGEPVFDEEGFTLVGTFDAAAQDSISDAYLQYGLVGEDGALQLIGEEEATISDDGSGQVEGFFDLTTFSITDGQDTALAYLDLTVDEETGLATIDTPLAYYAPDDPETAQDVTLSIVFDIETQDVVQEVYYLNDENGTVGELTADPEGIIVPQVLTVGDDGSAEFTATSDVGLFADLPNLLYEFDPIPSGTELYAELVVVDYGGNFASLPTQTVVP